MKHISKILDGLELVKRVREGEYIARCPAHDDRDPSLSLKETRDGKVLIHCHAGCMPAHVMAHLGLTLGDLYDEPLSHHERPLYMARRERQDRIKEESSIETERLVLAMADADRAKGRRLSQADLKREKEAYLRVKEWESRQ